MLIKTVKSLCEKEKITIAELERKTEIGNGSIRRWNESSPNAKSLMKIADFFNVSVDYLLGRAEFTPKTVAIAAKVQSLNPEKQNLLDKYIDALLAS